MARYIFLMEFGWGIKIKRVKMDERIRIYSSKEVPIIKTEKKLSVTISFVNKDGDRLPGSPEEIISQMSEEQRTRFKLLILEATTGKRYKPIQ